MGREAHVVKPRFARGCRCFAVVVDASIAGYGWLSTGPEWIGELQLDITPRPGEGYIWNCATLHAHRRKGIFGSLLVGISDAARHAGLERLWIGSVRIPAEKAVGPSGFEAALRFTTITIAGVHLLAVRDAADKNFSLAADARKVLASRGAPLTSSFSIRRRITKLH